MLKSYSFSTSLIILVTLVFAITLLILGYVEYYYATRSFLDQAFRTMETVAFLVGQNISQTMEEKTAELLLLAKEVQLGQVEPATVNRLLQFFDDALLVTDETGTVIKAWPENREVLIGENVSHREYFQKSQELTKPYLSGHVESIVGTNIVVLSVPLVEQGEFRGMISGGITLEQGKIGQFVSSTQFFQTGRIVILDQNHNVLLASNPESIGKTFSAFPLDSQTPITQCVGGEDCLVWVEDIPNTSWRVIALVQAEEILAPSQKVAQIGGILGVLILALTLFFLHLLLRRLFRPLSSLVSIAKEYAQGNYSPSSLVAGPQEIAQLSIALDRMRQAVKEREREITERQTRLETLLRQMNQGILVTNQEKKLQFVNHQLSELTGYSEKELIGKDLRQLFSEREKVEHLCQACSQGERNFEKVYLLAKAGRPIHVLLSASPLIIEGEASGTLIAVTDLREMEKKEEELEAALEEIKTLNQELEERNRELEAALAKLDLELLKTDQEKKSAQKLATVDHLTHLFNRRALEENLAQLFQAARLTNSPLSIIMVDIDHFKKINDTYGHLLGDKILQHLARTLELSLREVDLVFRFGGEEFVILFNGDKEKAQTVAERIRQKVENIHRRDGEGPERFTISLGVASYPQDAQTPEELLAKADQALYYAKRQGRNRVVSYRSDFTPLSKPFHFY